MSHHQDAIDEMTAEAHREHVAALQREIAQLRKQIALEHNLEGKDIIIAALVNAGIHHAFEVQWRDRRIAELEASQVKRTQLVVDATLRKAG